MSKTEKIIVILNQMILLPVASGGIKIRFYPFQPAQIRIIRSPIPVALRRRRKSTILVMKKITPLGNSSPTLLVIGA